MPSPPSNSLDPLGLDPGTKGSRKPRDQTQYSCIGRWVLYCSATRETHSDTELCFFGGVFLIVFLSSTQIFCYFQLCCLPKNTNIKDHTTWSFLPLSLGLMITFLIQKWMNKHQFLLMYVKQEWQGNKTLTQIF